MWLTLLPLGDHPPPPKALKRHCPRKKHGGKAASGHYDEVLKKQWLTFQPFLCVEMEKIGCSGLQGILTISPTTAIPAKGHLDGQEVRSRLFDLKYLRSINRNTV